MSKKILDAITVSEKIVSEFKGVIGHYKGSEVIAEVRIYADGDIVTTLQSSARSLPSSFWKAAEDFARDAEAECSRGAA